MKKYLITAAVLAVMTAPAMASKGKIASTPTTPYFVGTGAVVKDGKVYITAPYGSDVTVDVDGENLDVQVTKKDADSWSNVLPWNWSIFH